MDTAGVEILKKCRQSHRPAQGEHLERIVVLIGGQVHALLKLSGVPYGAYYRGVVFGVSSLASRCFAPADKRR